MELPTPLPPTAPPREGSPWILVGIWLLSAVLLAPIGFNVAFGAFFLPLFTWGNWELALALALLWAVPGAVALVLAPPHLCSMVFDRADPWRRRLTLWMSWSLGTAFGSALVIITVCWMVGPSF
ncbi:hypothetical protein DFP74_3470 [Nocardiopsis sp. Huas11]|uniref:hypothetical protein n=1 Tax=Nocardiopsis sp. Huas11 TaxID=2183912 RepID=UPI000EAF3065|nr:hypothetical protein [Nocardiopsis sp. Huas11]RKS07786.1 hypothetical protein DFP74_3470 [Nocardiopsis sp. Huas11]